MARRGDGVEIPIEARLSGFEVAYRQMVSGAQQASQKMERSFSSLRDSATGLRTAIGLIATGLVAQRFGNLVQSIAQFKDLSERIGDTSEAISSLRTPAATSGVAMEDIAAASIKLTSALSKTDEESDLAGQALGALGLKLNDFKALAPVEQLKTLARAFNSFSDDATSGAAKTAAAVALLGRSGASMLPFFNDLAEQSDRLTTLSREQIEAADRLSKQWGLLSSQARDLGQNIASIVVPALSEAIAEMQEGVKAAGGFWAALSAGATLNPFDNTSQAISKTRAKLEALNKASVGGGFIRDVNGEIVDATDSFKRLNAQLAMLDARQRRETKGLIGPEFLDARDLRAQGPSSRPALAFTATANSAKTAKKEADEFGKALERVNKLAADAQASLQEAFSGQPLLASQKALAELQASDTWDKLNPSQQAALKARYDMIAAVERETQAWKDKREATEQTIRAAADALADQQRAMQAFTANLGAYSEETDYLQRHIALLGQDDLARQKLAETIDYERLRKQAVMAEDLKGIEVLDEQYRKRIQLLEQLDAMQRKLRDIQEYSDLGASSLSQLGQRLTSGQNPLEAVQQTAEDFAGRLSQSLWDKAATQLFGKDGPLGEFGSMMSDLLGTGGDAAASTALVTAGTTLTTSGTTLVTAGASLNAAAAALTTSAAALVGGSAGGDAADAAGTILSSLFTSSAGGGGSVYGGPQFGSYARGISYVPNDQIALLHRGERVMTATENARERGSWGGGLVVNQVINVPPGANTASYQQAARQANRQLESQRLR